MNGGGRSKHQSALLCKLIADKLWDLDFSDRQCEQIVQDENIVPGSLNSKGLTNSFMIFGMIQGKVFRPGYIDLAVIFFFKNIRCITVI